MPESNPITWLTFFTLVAGLVVAAGGFLYFLSSRHNRYRAEQALLGTGTRTSGSTPDGALPELLGILVLAMAVMAMLTAGYTYR